jgi:hypothetical protein
VADDRRRVPVLLVIVPVFVVFALVLAWAIREGKELGLLSEAPPVSAAVVDEPVHAG